jgi:hypothetical protein
MPNNQCILGCNVVSRPAAHQCHSTMDSCSHGARACIRWSIANAPRRRVRVRSRQRDRPTDPQIPHVSDPDRLARTVHLRYQRVDALADGNGLRRVWLRFSRRGIQSRVSRCAGRQSGQPRARVGRAAGAHARVNSTSRGPRSRVFIVIAWARSRAFQASSPERAPVPCQRHRDAGGDVQGNADRRRSA